MNQASLLLQILNSKLSPPAARLQPHFPHTARQEGGDSARPGEGATNQPLNPFRNLVSSSKNKILIAGTKNLCWGSRSTIPAFPKLSEHTTVAISTIASPVAGQGLKQYCSSASYNSGHLATKSDSCHQITDLSLSSSQCHRGYYRSGLSH